MCQLLHWSPRNYLRARGEYPQTLAISIAAAELPPRTRRIREGVPNRTVEFGTTSAYAENTGGPATPRHCPRNYLRVRGEYCTVRVPPMG